MEDREILIIAFSAVGIMAFALGMFSLFLHKIYAHLAKQRKKKAGKINLLSGALFICLGISELLFSAGLSFEVPVFGWLGYGGTLITIILSLVSLRALKKYPEAEQDAGDKQR